MRSLDAAEIAVVQARTVAARDYVWVTAKRRDNGEPVSQGFWSDAGSVTVGVIDGNTGALTSRVFVGSGALLDIGPIALTADITVRTTEVRLSPIDAFAEALTRTYDVRGAPIQIYRGYFNPATRALVAPPKARFVGYVDGAPIVTPAEGGEGSITLRCVSTTRELTRTNPEVRSHASQLARTAGADDFYIDTAVVGDWDIAWGQNRGPVSSRR